MSLPVVDIAQWLYSEPQFDLAFQPLLALSSGNIIGFEVLTRPVDRNHRPLLVESFFHEASIQGHAVAVDRLIVGQITKFLQGHPLSYPLFINLHPDSLTDPDIQSMVGSSQHGAIVIEITERGNWFGDIVEPVMQTFRNQGGTVALDDFGTGYSGLEKLVAVRPNFVKLDRSIIAQCHMYPVKRNLIASVSHMAEFLGFQLIAEGIETREELLTCIDLGVAIGQGYYFARPSAWNPGVQAPNHVIHEIQRRQNELLESSAQNLMAWDSFRLHWSLLMESLADPQATPHERLMAIMASTFRLLQPTAMTFLRATKKGLAPVFSLGHSYQDLIVWDQPSFAVRAFRENSPVVLQKTSDTPCELYGPVMKFLNAPESIAIFPIGHPTWAVIGADYMGAFSWSESRLQVLRGMAHLLSVVIPNDPYLT
ncbi:EAL domain-containing protein [Sulfobacillus sp. hq2]|uniref:EAL domain-containing protein n=2 Tax=Sulfobacillus TaxID=28033 RepID=UPI000CD121DA|nr:EAL domain-containing protein [Sulfobacillus sp. hq2]POB10259.1 hypothetical protein CO251_09875 [Sulfobacillus sp. hq2]